MAETSLQAVLEALAPTQDLTPPPSLPELSGKALNVPAEMVLQIACGMEPPVDIAARFGFSDEEFGVLCQWQPFRDQVEAKRAELKQSGYTFRMQNAFFAEDLSKDLYVIAKGNDVPFSQKLDAYKTFTRYAGLEPQAQAQVQTGNGFSVSIVFAPPKEPEPKLVVDAAVTEVKE